MGGNLDPVYMLPLSVEELVNKKKEAQQNDRPRFIPKSKRVGTQRDPTSQVKTSTISRTYIPASKHKTDSLDVSSPTDPGSTNQRKRNFARTKFMFEWSADDDTSREDDLFMSGTPRSCANTSGAIPSSGDMERAQRQLAIEEQRRKFASQSAVKRQKREHDDVHWTKKPLGDMTDRDWRILKEDFQISSRGAKVPNPIRFWSESGIPASILKVIDRLSYKEPTPVQRATIPLAMAGQDVVGIAETGSGKTASFIIPIAAHILSASSSSTHGRSDQDFSPYCLILVPTRELAQQIESEAVKFCGPLNIRCVSLVGGHSMEEQSYKLHKSGQMAEIVIATPGRLIESLGRRMLGLGGCKYAVLDEADRMIDMGFEDQVVQIMSSLPSNDGSQIKRQTMMFTATWPRAIERMADKYLSNPGHIVVGSVGQATDRVEQRIEYITTESKRNQRLLEALRQFSKPMIIFANTKNACDSITKVLQRADWRCAIMHGGRTQEQRETALQQLRSGSVECLVATDVAGRGIDVPNVTLVVNYQMPKSLDTYTHRIGRTGRAGKSGVAISFVGPEDEDLFYDLKIFVNKSKNSSSLPEQVRGARAKVQAITE